MKVRDVLSYIGGIGSLVILSFGFNGYTLSVLWGWFIVPIFSAPKLAIVPAIGIAIVANHLTYQLHNYKEEEQGLDDKIIDNSVVVILKSSIALFFGWIVHLFM